MVHLIATIFIFCLMLCLSAYYANKPITYVQKRQMKDATVDSLSAQLIEAVKPMRVYESTGRGVRIDGLYRRISHANRLIERKIKKGVPLSDAERWLYENFYLVYRFIFSLKDDMSDLPSVDEEPRILKIARIIVDNSLGDFSVQRLRAVLEKIKGSVSFTFGEIRALNNALGIAIVEQIYILSERLIYNDRCKKQAQNGEFRPSNITKDVYLYHLMQNPEISEKAKKELEIRGIDAKSILLNYNLVLMRNTVMAETLFGALMHINEYVPERIGLEYLGAYAILSENCKIDDIKPQTLSAYFARIEKIAFQCRVSEDFAVKKLTELAEYNAKDVSTILFDYGYALRRYISNGKLIKVSAKKSLYEILYALTVFIFGTGLAVASGIFLRNAIFGILSFIPFFFVSENIINYLFSHLKCGVETPSMGFKKIPYEHSALVVICEYITGIEHLKDSIKHAQGILYGNNDSNIGVALLIDTKGGNVPVSDLDREIIDYLESVKLEDNLNIFLRKKSHIGDKFVAKERKRGAIMAFCKMLIMHEDFEFLYIKRRNYITPKYIVTLDADNTMLPGEVVRMINMMAHPYNYKYDLLAMHGRNSLFSLKNRYSSRFMSESGFEEYPNYSGLYYKLFKTEIFCGKGIFRLERFYNKLEEILPSGKILSHDILEGSILNTGSGGLCFEDAPENFLSDRERKKRWLRGDIQLLPFLFGLWKNDEKKTCRSYMSPIGQFVIVRNILGVLREICLLALFILGLFSSNIIIYSALALFGIPYIVNQIKILRGIVAGEGFNSIMTRTYDNIRSAIMDFFMLGYLAVDNLRVMIGTLFRMICGKNLLNWKTYYSTQAAKAFEAYVKEFTVPFLALTAVAALILGFGGFALPFLIYLLITFVEYVYLYFEARLQIKENSLCDEDKKRLLDIASNTYKYFCFMRNSNGLIGDNLQIKPYKGIAKNTSPTNLGFSILAEICAHELGFISLEECVFNVNTILFAISGLDKWYGNLYNWYDIETQKPVMRYVSSVDNGNLAAVLLVISEYMKDKGEAVTAGLANKIYYGMELDKLFDKSKNLFYIGWDGEKASGHYDLLASEARILSYIYIARYGDYEHYSCLQKDFSGIKGNTLLSWSGTMFEMLLPEIFFKSPKGSMMYHSARSTVKIQISKKKKGVWGVSESGYYAFDADMKYQYSAFGISELALASDTKEDVVAPYASLLALRYAPREVLSNVEKLIEEGMGFEYGLYEGIDFGKNGNIVYSAMSHHQGMILASITNFLRDDVFPKTLARNVRLRALTEYFNDVRPHAHYNVKRKEKKRKYNENKNNYYKSIDNLEQNYTAFGISDTQYSVLCNQFGGGFSRVGNIFLNRFDGIIEESDGMFFYASVGNGEYVSPTFLPYGDFKKNYSFACTGEELIFKSSDGLIESIVLLTSVGGEVRRLSATGEYKDVGFYFDLCLDAKDAYDSHPAFRNLFISTEKIRENILLVTKKTPGKKGSYLYLAVRVEGVKNINWECNKLNFIGRGNSLANPAFFIRDENSNVNYPSLGDVLAPCVGFSASFKGEQRECQVCLLYGLDKNEILQTIMSLPVDMYRYGEQSVKGFVPDELTQSLLGPILYAPHNMPIYSDLIDNCKIEQYFKLTNGKRAISYELDLLKPEKLRRFVEAVSQLRVFDMEILPIVYSKNKIPESVEKYIVKLFENCRIAEYRIVDDTSEERFFADIEVNSDLTNKKISFDFSKVFYAEHAVYRNALDNAYDLPEIVFATGEGGFDASGRYIVNGAPLLPYANVIGHKNGGLVVTSDGGGFYYFGNSRENKSVRFENDSLGKGGERIYVKTLNGFIDIAGGFGKNRYSVIEKGKYTHNYYGNTFSSSISYTVICNGSVKLTEARISKRGEYIEFVYCFYPSLNWKYDSNSVIFEQTGDLIKAYNMVSKRRLYVRILGIKQENLTLVREKATVPYFEYGCENDEERIYIAASEDLSLILSLNTENLSILKLRSEEYFNRIGDIDITTPVKSLNYLVNFLPYQIVSSRLNAKAGFYQVGGATGFRDQLQDALALFYRPEILKERIAECCLHQYEAGDVMHWWHEPKYGLRTRITDDKLFLPYAVVQYLSYSGDKDFLQEEYPYLSSQELHPREKDRFENPPYTTYKESVFMHCLRAIRSSLKYGEHKLLIMGKGDWNDGMDEICARGEGESVFNSMLAHMVLRDFACFCDGDLKTEMNTVSVELKKAVNLYAYENDRYKRLYSDDGRWLGSERSTGLKLDLLVQAFAVISGVADGERALACLKTAEGLIDRDAGIIKLLYPPLSDKDYLGYISDYPEGVRENGGQYTHAAMWYLIALTKVGRQDFAFELFQMINPVEKCTDKSVSNRYKCEPYVLAGDIYSNKDNYGRGGWSWYTGSAGWAYKLVTEYFFGLKKRGDDLFIEPSLPKKLEGSVLVYRYKNSSYIIEYRTGLLKKITIDGVPCEKIKLGENVRKTVVVETGF